MSSWWRGFRNRRMGRAQAKPIEFHCRWHDGFRYAQPILRATAFGLLRRDLERHAVDTRFASQIVDGDVRVIPGEPGANAETLRQFGDPRLRKPGLRSGAALPEIDAAGAGLAIEIILSDQPLSGEPAIDRRRAGATRDGLILRALGQIKLNDDNAICHDCFL